MRLRAAAAVAAIVTVACSDATGSRAVSLRFSQQPADGVAGQAVSAQVQFVDADGNVVAAIHDAVTARLYPDGEPLTVHADNGIASFDNFVITAAADDHVLDARASGVRALSLPFRVHAAAANGAQSAVEEPAQPVVSNTPSAIMIRFADEFGNHVRGAPVTLGSSTPGVTFSPATGRTNQAGIFATMIRVPAPGSAALTAVVGGTSIEIGQPVTVADACAHRPFSIPGTLTGILIAGQGCIADGAPIVRYQFMLPQPGGVQFTIGAEFFGVFELRTDPAIPNVPLNAPEPVVREWILPAGTFYFRLASAFSQGQYSIQTRSVPANAGDTMRVLAAAGTYTGQSLAPGDFVNSVESFTDLFAFFAARPCTITLRSTAFDAYLELTSAFGQTIGVDDNSGGGTDAQITRASCTSANNAIRIHATSAFSGQTGPYTLIITFN